MSELVTSSSRSLLPRSFSACERCSPVFALPNARAFSPPSVSLRSQIPRTLPKAAQDQRGAHRPHGERRHFCGALDFAACAVCCSGAHHCAARRGAGEGEHTQPSSHHTERELALTLTTTHAQAQAQALTRWRSSGRPAGAGTGAGSRSASVATQKDTALSACSSAAARPRPNALERDVNDAWRSVHRVCIYRT